MMLAAFIQNAANNCRYDMLVDKAYSGRVFWLNKLTLASTYEDPYAVISVKGIQRRREMEEQMDGAEISKARAAAEARARQAAGEGKDDDDEERARTKPFDIHFAQFNGNGFRLREFPVDATVADVKKEVIGQTSGWVNE